MSSNTKPNDKKLFVNQEHLWAAKCPNSGSRPRDHTVPSRYRDTMYCLSEQLVAKEAPLLSSQSHPERISFLPLISGRPSS